MRTSLSVGNDTPHVVHIVETLQLGGMERAIATLCRALSKRGVRTSVIALKELGTVADELMAYGIDVHLAGVPVAPPDYLAWRRVVPVLRRLRPTVVHTHNSAALIFGAPSARMCGVRTVIHTDHGRVFPDRAHIMLAERLVSYLLRGQVAVSQPLASAIAKHLRIPLSRIRVIPNGVERILPAEPERSRALRQQWFRTEDVVVVGLAARLVWEKGLRILLDAWPSVLLKHPKARLVIGGEGPERAALEAQIESLGLSGAVRLPGVIHDIQEFYGTLDMFVLPSVAEGLPLALLEAMSAGLPIVATSVGGIPSVLEAPAAGRLVTPNDSVALSAAICEVLGNLGEGSAASAMGARAREEFARNYTSEAMADSYQVLYDEGYGR
jgi:glycosyltransferase involved in cell wall biosynthesis